MILRNTLKQRQVIAWAAASIAVAAVILRLPAAYSADTKLEKLSDAGEASEVTGYDPDAWTTIKERCGETVDRYKEGGGEGDAATLRAQCCTPPDYWTADTCPLLGLSWKNKENGAPQPNGPATKPSDLKLPQRKFSSEGERAIYNDTIECFKKKSGETLACVAETATAAQNESLDSEKDTKDACVASCNSTYSACWSSCTTTKTETAPVYESLSDEIYRLSYTCFRKYGDPAGNSQVVVWCVSYVQNNASRTLPSPSAWQDTMLRALRNWRNGTGAPAKKSTSNTTSVSDPVCRQDCARDVVECKDDCGAGSEDLFREAQLLINKATENALADWYAAQQTRFDLPPPFVLPGKFGELERQAVRAPIKGLFDEKAGTLATYELGGVAEGQVISPEVPEGFSLEKVYLTAAGDYKDRGLEIDIAFGHTPDFVRGNDIPAPDPRKYELKEYMRVETVAGDSEVHPWKEAVFQFLFNVLPEKDSLDAVMLRWNQDQKEWDTLPTEKVSCGLTTCRYLATSPGTSYFALAVEREEGNSAYLPFIITSLLIWGSLAYFIVRYIRDKMTKNVKLK